MHDNDAMENAMRARKNGTTTSTAETNGTLSLKEVQAKISESTWLQEEFKKIKVEVDGYKTVVQVRRVTFFPHRVDGCG